MYPALRTTAPPHSRRTRFATKLSRPHHPSPDNLEVSAPTTAPVDTCIPTARDLIEEAERRAIRRHEIPPEMSHGELGQWLRFVQDSYQPETPETSFAVLVCVTAIELSGIDPVREGMRSLIALQQWAVGQAHAEALCLADGDVRSFVTEHAERELRKYWSLLPEYVRQKLERRGSYRGRLQYAEKLMRALRREANRQDSEQRGLKRHERLNADRRNSPHIWNQILCELDLSAELPNNGTLHNPRNWYGGDGALGDANSDEQWLGRSATPDALRDFEDEDNGLVRLWQRGSLRDISEQYGLSYETIRDIRTRLVRQPTPDEIAQIHVLFEGCIASWLAERLESAIKQAQNNARVRQWRAAQRELTGQK